MKKLVLYVVLIAITASGCREVFGKRIRGSGNIKSETRSVSSFNNVDVTGSIDVYVRQDSNFSARVETDDNLLEYVVVENRGGTLTIHQREGFNIKSSKGVKVYVSGSAFKRFEASGACDLYTENAITSNDKIDLDLSGACGAKMQINAARIDADLSGACSVTLSGTTKEVHLGGSGSSKFHCFDLLSENVQVRISGAGDAEVHASVSLDVSVSGAGSVHYKGSPTVNQSISGAGSVKKVD